MDYTVSDSFLNKWKKKKDEEEKLTPADYGVSQQKSQVDYSVSDKFIDSWKNGTRYKTDLEEKQEERRKKAPGLQTLNSYISPYADRKQYYQNYYVSGSIGEGLNFRNVAREILGVEYEDGEVDPNLLLYSLDQKRLSTKDRNEQLKYLSLKNNLKTAAQADLLANTKMDGQNHSVLEEIQLIANLEGKEKKERKKAVLKKMESLGISESEYALFTNDSNFTFENTSKALGWSLMSGLTGVEAGVTNTLDVILGSPLKAMGWENNPISKLNDYYQYEAAAQAFNSNYYQERAGGGKAWQIANEVAQGVGGATPSANLAVMTAGTSTIASTTSLTNQAAYASGDFLTKAGITGTQMMKNPQLWTSFASTLGNDYEEAKKNGANDYVAAVGATVTSLLNAGIEIGFDGGSGIQGLADDLAKGNKKAVWAWVESALEEGGEEGLQKFVGEIVTKSMYDHDADILNMGEYGKEMALGTSVGAILGSGQTTVQSGVNMYNQYQAHKLTADEQTVVDKVTESLIAQEQQKSGKELSKSEKNKISKTARMLVEKGYVKAETIESILGGESYEAVRKELQAYKDSDLYKQWQTAKKGEEDLPKLQEEYDKLHAMKRGEMTGEQIDRETALKEQIEAIKNAPKSADLGVQLTPEATRVRDLVEKFRGDMYERVKGGRLAESFKERARSREKFTADPNKYDSESARQTVQGVLDSNLGNGTNEFADKVDFLARLSERTGHVYKLVTEEQLKEAGHWKEGFVTHGLMEDSTGDVLLNYNSERNLYWTIGHETGHVVEQSGSAKALHEALFNHAIAKEGLDKFNARLKEKEEAYKGRKDTTPEQELANDLLGEYIFTDYDFIKNLANSDRNVFQKIWDELKYYYKLATAGSQQQRELEKAMHYFQKALDETGKGQKNTATSGVEGAGISDSNKTMSREEYDMWRIEELNRLNPQLGGAIKGEIVDSDFLSGESTDNGTRLVGAHNGSTIRRTKSAKSGTFTHEILHAIDMLSGYNVRGYVEDLASGKGFDSYDSLIDYLKTAREQGKIDGRMTDAEEISQMVLNAFYADREGLRKAAPEFTGFLEEMGLDKYSHIAKSYDKYVAETDGDSHGGVKYSLNRNARSELHIALYDLSYDSEVLLRDVTPPIMTSQNGVRNLPMGMNASHIRENVFTEEEAANLGLKVDEDTHYHGLGEEFFLKIIDGLDNVKEAYRGTRYAENPSRRENYFLLVSEFTDENGDIINVPVYIDEHAQFNRVFVDVNKISTVYGKRNFRDYIKRQIQRKNLVRIKNRSIQTSEHGAPIAPHYGENASSEAKIAQNDPVVKGKLSISKDSRGRDIPNDIQELLQFSQVRDESGHLIPMYHGTPNGSIAQFKAGTYFTENREYADRYQNPGASSISTGKVASNPKTFEVYLDIRKPFDLSDAEARRIYIEEYIKGGNAMGINPYLSDAEYARIKSIDWTEGEDLRDFLIDNGYDYDGLVLDEGADGGYGEEVKYRGKSYVIFNPEQVVSLDSKADSGAKFSMSKAVEESRDLMALHNLKAEELLKSLDLGGLPMPSIAVIKANAGHEQYGDISLVFPKDTIDPKKDKANKVYGGDAWTPTYPKMEYKPSETVAKRIRDKYRELYERFGYDEVRPMYDYQQDMERVLNRAGGEENLLEELYNDTDLMQLYLQDIGRGKVEPVVTETETRMSDVEIEMSQYIINALGEDVIAGFKKPEGSLFGTAHHKQFMEEHDAEIRAAYKQYFIDTHQFTEEQASNVVDKTSQGQLLKYIRNAYNYTQNNGVTINTKTDYEATWQAIRDASQDGYREWVDNLFKGVQEKTGIRNNTDYYTRSGNARSWDALHWENTLENVVKAMKQQDQTGSEAIFGVHKFFAAASKDYKSVDEIRADADRLHKIDDGEYKAAKDSYEKRLSDIASRMVDKTASNQFIAFDNALECIVDAVRRSKSKAAIYKELSSYEHLTVTESDVDDIVSLVNDIANMPTGYFEAKPQRAVGFDEVAAFVIPRNADIKLKQALLSKGYNIAEYDPDVEGDRTNVLNNLDEYKFSLSKKGEGVPAENRVLNDRWSDFDRADPLAEIAPVRKDIAPKTSPIPKGDVAPAPATVSNTETVEEMFPDEPMSIEQLYDRQAEIKDLLYAALDNGDQAVIDNLSIEYENIRDQIAELEADEADRFDSIEDTDAPPETDIAPFERADVVPLTKKAAQDIARDVRQKLALSNKHMHDVHTLIEEYSKSEFPDREQLFRDIKEKFGTYTESEFDETVKEAKSYLRTYGLFVDYSIKNEIADYAHLMRKNRGRIRFSKDGTAVDVLYHELNELFPHLFPEDIIAPTDQFLQMVDVANMDAESVVEQQLPDEAIWDVANALADSVADYQQTQREKAANKHGREAFDTLMQDADKYVPPVKINMIPNRRNPMGTENPDAPVAEIYDTQHKKGVVEGQQAMWNDPVPESPGARRKIKMEEHTEKWKNLIGDTSTWKDMALGLSYKTRTLRRILRKVVRGVDGKPDIGLADQIYDELETKYDHNEALLKRESARVKAVFEKLNLNHHEDTYAHMLGELRHNPETTLTQDVVDEFYKKHKKHIDTKKVDTAISEARKTFDDLLVRVNTVLREQGFKEIPYRQGYFPHFTNPKQGWLAKLLNWKTIDTEVPTSIAGLTEQFKPQRSWQSFNKERKGDTTDYSLYQGLDTYIHGALDWIYHIDDLQSRRSLENYLRYIHSEEGVKARIDEIKANNDYDADEAQKLIDAILAEADNPLSGLVRELMNRTNTLANKKAAGDRKMEDDTNRKVYSVMTNLNNRINANMVVGSISSALTNFIPMVQSWHQVSPYFTVRGLGDYLRSVVRDDGMMERSDYLTNRLMDEEKLYQTGWDKVTDKAAWMMNIADRITTNTVWRSKYLQNIKEGMSEAQAIKDADQFAKNVMAGRSRGNAPTIFDEKNPRTKLFTAFQLEVANQYGYMFEDVPKDSKNMARLVKGYATALVGAYVYNALYSSLVGRDVAFDPIKIIEELFKDLSDDDEEPEDIALNLVDNVLEEVPFVGGLIGGGRIPISSALPYEGDYKTFISDAFNGEIKAKEMLKPLYYLAMPVAGGQIKKTVEGLSMFDDDLPVTGSYTDSGKLRFPVEDTLPNRVQAGLFGQYASDNARYYFDNDIAPLGAKQIQEYKDVDIPIRDYWDYRKGLSGLTKAQEKADYINGLDLPTSKKNILINNQLDRKEPVDMTDYDDFGSLEEFDFANKNPERYDFLTSIGVSYKDYKNASEEEKDVYNWAFEYPDKYALSKVVTKDLFEYKKYTSDLGDIRADKDAYGKSISGSAKEKKKKYIFSLDIDMGAKFIMYKDAYPSVDDYNDEIVEYLNSRDDLTYDERVSILKELGFTVRNGRVYYD